jgi:hypothetical protein
MAMTADVIEFTRDDTASLLARMHELSAVGSGWINIGPGLTPEEFASLPPRSALSKWVSGRGPAVPMATWTPRSTGGRGSPCQVGIAHGTGPNAIARLEDAGVELPAGWRKQQDHAKNGIVAEVPDSVAHDAVVDWMIRAMVALSPRVKVGEDWIAEAYGG